MQSVKALRRWLVIVALLRLLAGMESVCPATSDVNRDAHFSAYDIVATCTDMLSAVFLGYFDHTKFKTNLFDDAPQEGGLSDCYAVVGPVHARYYALLLLLVLYVAVTELCGRVFGIWTLLTCALCCICARNPCVPSIYGRLQHTNIGCLTLWTATGGTVCTTFLWPAGATLFSFVAALCFFLLELFVYQTVGWKSALQPLIVAGE